MQNRERYPPVLNERPSDQYEPDWLGDIAAVALFKVINVPFDNILSRNFIEIGIHHIMNNAVHGHGARIDLALVPNKLVAISAWRRSSTCRLS